MNRVTLQVKHRNRIRLVSSGKNYDIRLREDLALGFEAICSDKFAVLFLTSL